MLGPRTSGRVTSLVRLLTLDCTRIRNRKLSPRPCPPEPPSGTGPGRARGGAGRWGWADAACVWWKGRRFGFSILRLPVGAGAGWQGSKPGRVSRQARGGPRALPVPALRARDARPRRTAPALLAAALGGGGWESVGPNAGFCSRGRSYYRGACKQVRLQGGWFGIKQVEKEMTTP